jgi:Polyketide cyclase / dehydrase and lipid transport
LATAILDDMETLRTCDSIVISRSPEELYDMIADVTRMGDWSPMCEDCWWDEGDGPRVGAKFTGRNGRAERTWETRSEVVAADRGREFAWVVAEPPTRARWGYSFVAVDGGTKVTETWELPPEGCAFFEKRFGDTAPQEIAKRRGWATEGIPTTLDAIKRAAET